MNDVLALNCQITNNTRKKETKCKIKQITDYFNFEYLRNGLLVHRSWDVGSGLLIPWSQLNCNRSNFDLISQGIENFVDERVQTKEQSIDQSMDADGCVEQEEMLSTKRSEQGNFVFFYECNIEQGCTTTFVKFSNLINHILVGKHRRVIEKLSLKDTAMEMYHSKLEEIENRRIISLDMNLIDMIDDEISPLSKGSALSTRKSNTEFSDKQREYLKKKFNEGVEDVKQWKLRGVVLDMETLRENNKFYFLTNEILKESRIRSFFGRLKREKQMSAAQQTAADKLSGKEQTVKISMMKMMTKKSI